jgi:hypothetical protein
MDLLNRGLHAPFDGQVELPLLIVKSALFAQYLGLRLLRFGQLGVIGIDGLPKLSHLVGAGEEFRGTGLRSASVLRTTSASLLASCSCWRVSARRGAATCAVPTALALELMNSPFEHSDRLPE